LQLPKCTYWGRLDFSRRKIVSDSILKFFPEFRNRALSEAFESRFGAIGKIVTAAKPVGIRAEIAPKSGKTGGNSGGNRVKVSRRPPDPRH
jgi:hypothetical protein